MVNSSTSQDNQCDRLTMNEILQSLGMSRSILQSLGILSLRRYLSTLKPRPFRNSLNMIFPQKDSYL